MHWLVLFSRVKKALCGLSRFEHGLPTAAVGFVASAHRPPLWTTLRRATLRVVNNHEVAL